MNREVHVRICGRLGAKFPGPTRRLPGPTLLIVWNQRSLRRILRSYVAYYQHSRTHLALGRPDEVPESFSFSRHVLYLPPPLPPASEPRSSALPCACSSTYSLPLPFAQIILGFVRKRGSRSVPSGPDFWILLPKGSYLKVVVPPLVPGTTACVNRFSKSQV
jgi:hypothetical protein